MTRERSAQSSSPLSRSRQTIERELMQFGLTHKEAQVYLAALEIGGSPVQAIAKRAGVNRATSYVCIESLVQRGLMSSVERHEKRLYIAEPPERLRQLVRRDEDRLIEAREALDRLLPELGVLLKAAPERPCVRFYEGIEGLEAMRNDCFSGKKHELLSISAADDYHRIVGMARRLPHAKRMERTRGFERCMFTSSRSREVLRRALPVVADVERYRIPTDRYPLCGEITIYGEKVAMLSYRGTVMGVLIESPFLAQTARSLFNLAWETVKQYEKFE